MMRLHHHFYFHIEAREEVMRRLDAIDDKLASLKELTMSTVEELTALLTTISTEVDKVSADTDNLLAQLKAIPTGGVPPAVQTAIDAAVTSAQGIATRLQAIDDKVPDAAPPAA